MGFGLFLVTWKLTSYDLYQAHSSYEISPIWPFSWVAFSSTPRCLASPQEACIEHTDVAKLRHLIRQERLERACSRVSGLTQHLTGGAKREKESQEAISGVALILLLLPTVLIILCSAPTLSLPAQLGLFWLAVCLLLSQRLSKMEEALQWQN